jgi:hypothetical protein
MQHLAGSIGFSLYKKKGFFGLLARAIRYFTHGKWSHTFVCFIDDEVTGNWVVEAGELGVAVNNFDKYIDASIYDFAVYAPKTTPDVVAKALQRVARLNGKSYGYGQLIGFVLVWLVRKITLKKVSNPFGGGWICSELTLDYCLDLGLETDRFRMCNRDTTSPEELRRIIESSPSFEKVMEHASS